MPSKKRAAAPADGAETVGDLATSWPQPPGGPVVDRIQVAAIDLYTDPTKNQVERVELESLQESPFNPRTRYDDVALQELASTVRDVGVMQPLLVRRLSVDAAMAYNKANPSKAGQHEGLLEIVFGHRRYRAAKLAGVASVPAIVRDLTDAQAAQLQAIENVQRKDLDPIEEALGYEHYIKVHGVTKDQLAAEVGLSRSHVYSRLKLLQLPDAVRQACSKGEIGSEVALLIARIHTPKLQERALSAIKSKYYDLEDGGQRSFRQIRELLREKFTLKLSEAIFPIADATLLDGADACTTCPKRAGNAPEYSDLAEGYKGSAWSHRDGRTQGTPNLCTDPDCFEAKKKAHLKRKAAELEAKGKTVIAGNKARQLVSAQGELKPDYIALKDVKAQLPKAKKGEAPAALPTVVIQDPRNGKTIEAVKVEDLKAAGVKATPAKPARRGYDHAAWSRQQEAERKKRELVAAEETRFNLALLSAVREAAAGKPFTTQLLQLVAAHSLEAVEWEGRELLASLHECKNFEQLRKQVGQLPPDRLTTLLLDCALIENVKSSGYREHKPTALLAAAKHLDVDQASIKKELAKKPADTKTQDLLQEPAGDEHQDEQQEEEAAA
jgi:ParB/RepB/Spo0J family partition protein